MAKGIILYQSKYGATKKYANWLAEQTEFTCIETSKADINQLALFDTVIFGGGIYASGIAGIPFLKKNIGKLSGKKLAVFCVGASPYEEQAFQEIYNHNFKGSLEHIPCFYCRGAWNEEQMSLKDRVLCKMLQKAIAKKDPSEYEPWMTALTEAIGKKCDWTNKIYLEPLIAYIKNRKYPTV